MTRIIILTIFTILFILGRALYFYYKPLSKKLPQVNDANSIKKIPTEILHQSIRMEADENDQNSSQYTYHLNRHIWLSKYIQRTSLNGDLQTYYTLTWIKYYKRRPHKLPVHITCLDNNHHSNYEISPDITSMDISVEKESYYIFPSVIFFWPETTYKVQTSTRIPDIFVEHLLSSSILRIIPHGQKPIELKNIAFTRQRYWIKILFLIKEIPYPIL
ncbi:hypothetical protein PVA44_06490 [Entomospira nematocerorum]|uniref:Uncharacterized protein n=1 Tax=Entomospira nematocerorum TaxID=2719987 RepID=A0A968GEK2_9SPIO|nr:hypothetical protein [Entomospira nematocera]NIZ46331.1 hypothetical protein [Entomospira nematocera]WDI33865.1 hypothetical protein PVA44_06490 [Entomospira nematocera]